MRLEALFHLSFYLTLALAAVCLALPSTFFLPWMPVFVLVVLGLLWLAWRREGAWVLSETAANHLGVFIAIGAAGWILFKIPRSEDELVMTGVNWPAGLLPHLGPLLMILLVVKVFRPKRLPDYWVIQTMGLMMVTLAAVLADHHTFGLLVVLYLASLIWSLALYYPVRERALAGAAQSVNHMPLFSGSAASQAAPWRLWGLPRTALWTVTIALMGFVIFLAAPRQGQSQWNARQLSTVSGAAVRGGAEAGIDLNRTGTIELSEEPAFSVTVVDHEGHRINPGVIGRWRVEVLDVYAGGRWYLFATAREATGKGSVKTRILPTESEPAAVREGELLVTFRVRRNVVGGLVLAEPLDLERGIGLGPRLSDEPQRMGFFAVLDGCDTFVPATTPSRKTYAYSQLMRAPTDDLVLPAADVQPEYIWFLESQGVPSGPLISWTRDLLKRLPRLNDRERALDANGRLPVASHAKAAQALCDHLVHSGEYTYSLNLRRQARDMDPTVDFLVNVKEGHCERYAGGLALMLRSLGVRCRVVKGYIGGEMDEAGQGIVRKSGAHTWVQALVPGETGEWQWLMLDPTPSASAADNALSSWWRWCTENLFDSRVFWRQFIMEYTPEQQGETLGRFLNSLASRRGALVLLFLGGAAAAIVFTPRVGRRLVVAARGWWSRSSVRASARIRFYQDFLRMVQRQRGLAPRPGQTPREFAAELSVLLQQSGTAGAIQQTPERIISCYYHVRYGAGELTAHERTELAEMTAALASALRQR